MDEKKREVTMSDAEIERILKDPNTWAWDGCTYPENDVDMSHLDATFDEIFKKAGLVA